MNREILKHYFEKYGLSSDDFFKHQHYTIISRSGIEKIQAKEQINIQYLLEKCERDFAVIKAIATKDGIALETYGSALKGDFKTGNTNTWYITEMAEKRAFSRAILKMTGLYMHGVFGEDESESFKRDK